jgi:outer membrane protein OmpA-like peptidoglycan-associated protein/Tol biopolymer transport system component
MRKYFTCILFVLGGLTTQAQYNPDHVPKKARELNEKALILAEDGKYSESISVLKQATTIDSRYVDAYLSIAGMYGEMKKYDSAVRYYDIASKIDSDYCRDYQLPYSINLAGLGRFNEALQSIGDFLTIQNLNDRSKKAGEYRRKCYQFAVDQAKDQAENQTTFAPRNMGDAINTAALEYFPALTIDGQSFIFTRREKGNEDFYGSQLQGQEWLPATLLQGNINSNLNEGAQNISQDGKWLIFTGCNFPDGYGSCDLYISYLTHEGWSLPDNLGDNINTEYWESAPSLSPDKKELYFAAKRPVGYGGSDLYVSRRQPNGKWTRPENLGPEINTLGDESSPFLHADNQTLYFTSNGHQGYGGDDLFVTRKGPKGKWSIPINLGYPINTIENEGSIVVSASGQQAFYASDRADSRGGLDLYSFELKKSIRPIRTLWIKGMVSDSKTKKGIPAHIELTDLTTREVISSLTTDESGAYLLTLPVGRNYACNVNKKGYLFYSENFPLATKDADSTYQISIELSPIELAATVTLKNIFFASKSSELQKESFIELESLIRLLQENPTLILQVNGHTDNVGKESDNVKLSTERAAAVVNYLQSKGIAASRIKPKGFGATQPIADNKTEAGRAKNRRTDITVINK